MDVIKDELAVTKSKLYATLHAREIIIKIILFIVVFSALFWYIRIHNILPEYQLEQDLGSIPFLFGAGNLMFSIIGAFIIQAQWTKWDRLTVSTRGEITMLRQLYILVHHFPNPYCNQIRFRIYQYLNTYIRASNFKNYKSYQQFLARSSEVDTALVKIEDSMFDAYKKYPDVGAHTFGYLTRAMEYREEKLQNATQRLPVGIKAFVIFGTASVAIGSLFVPFESITFNYYFALVVASLAFGVYLIIDDFDHPYKPGNFVLTVLLHKQLMEEIKAKLEQRGFDMKNMGS